MKLKCLSTGSKGNCYLLENSKRETLIIELGIKQEEIFRNIKEISKIVGAIYTHNHGDHNLKVQKEKKNCHLMREWGINVRGVDNSEVGERIRMGEYEIIPLPAIHDIPCYSYLINCEGKSILFATDTSRLIKVQNTKIDYFVVEVNYIKRIMNEMLEEMQEDEDIDLSVQAMNTANKHMALETLSEYFSNLGYKPKKIYTIHGSGRKWFDMRETQKELEKYVERKEDIRVVKGGESYAL